MSKGFLNKNFFLNVICNGNIVEISLFHPLIVQKITAHLLPLSGIPITPCLQQKETKPGKFSLSVSLTLWTVYSVISFSIVPTNLPLYYSQSVGYIRQRWLHQRCCGTYCILHIQISYLIGPFFSKELSINNLCI